MQKLVWKNSIGDEIDLTSGNYGITEWEGFSNTSLNIQSQQVPFQDGGVFLDALMEQRELSVTLAMNDGGNLETRYRLRRELIHILNPKLGEGYLIYTNDFISKRIKCIAQIPLFETHNSNDSGTPKASLAWTACEPYWEDLEETEVNIQIGSRGTINYDGDVPAQMNIFTDIENAKNIELKIGDKAIKYIGEIAQNTDVSTISGNKKAENLELKNKIKMYNKTIFCSIEIGSTGKLCLGGRNGFIIFDKSTETIEKEIGLNGIYINDIIYVNNTYYAIGTNGDVKTVEGSFGDTSYIYSSQDCETWNLINSVNQINGVTRIVFNKIKYQNGHFYLLNRYCLQFVVTDDFINYTQLYSDYSDAKGGDFYLDDDICIIGGGKSSITLMVYSTDLTTFYATSIDGKTGVITQINKYGNYYIALMTRNTPKFAYSTDGINWSYKDYLAGYNQTIYPTILKENENGDLILSYYDEYHHKYNITFVLDENLETKYFIEHEKYAFFDFNEDYYFGDSISFVYEINITPIINFINLSSIQNAMYARCFDNFYFFLDVGYLKITGKESYVLRQFYGSNINNLSFIDNWKCNTDITCICDYKDKAYIFYTNAVTEGRGYLQITKNGVEDKAFTYQDYSISHVVAFDGQYIYLPAYKNGYKILKLDENLNIVKEFEGSILNIDRLGIIGENKLISFSRSTTPTVVYNYGGSYIVTLNEDGTFSVSYPAPNPYAFNNFKQRQGWFLPYYSSYFNKFYIRYGLSQRGILSLSMNGMHYNDIVNDLYCFLPDSAILACYNKTAIEKSFDGIDFNSILINCNILCYDKNKLIYFDEGNNLCELYFEKSDNIINKITGDMNLILEEGENKFETKKETGTGLIQIKYRQKYIGV